MPIKNSIQLISFALFLSVQFTFGETNSVSVTINQHIISSLNPLFFGNNYERYIAGTQSYIKPLNIKFLRAGGTGNDQEYPDPLIPNFADNFARYCSNIGAEPMFQVPLVNKHSTRERVSRAMELLSYYIDTKNYSIAWVDIGNEPDIYNLNYYNLPAHDTDLTNWNKYIDSYTNVAASVKSRYHLLKIAGPDLAFDFNNPGHYFLKHFLRVCGKYVNAVSLHYYPAWPNSAATYDMAANQFDIITNLYNTLSNTIYTYGQGQPVIISECQISAGNLPSEPYSEASMGTFEAGLWLADFLGISSSQPNVLSIMPYCIAETWGLSFLDIKAGNLPKPIYYIYYLFSNHTLTNMIACIKPADDIRIYAYKDIIGNSSIFCVNWNKKVPCSVNFIFKEELLNNTNITYVFPPLSLTCLSISADLSQRTAYSYSSTDTKAGQGVETNDF